MSFLLDRIKIQVLGLFILTSAAVTLRKIEHGGTNFKKLSEQNQQNTVYRAHISFFGI